MSRLFHLAQLRHLWCLMLEGHVKDTAKAARGLLGPAIEHYERVEADGDSEIRRLREALEWYADACNYDADSDVGGGLTYSEADFDRGNRARKALEGK